ncbi:heterokaryon incompatibility protein-domain-containing protein [Xylaria cubensis]|nr:heterokaryon incompatibility protein-domain-containing protein [Xylaria cubensis]
MPRQLPEPHSCLHCERLFFNTATCSPSMDQKVDQWKQFVAPEAVNTLEKTSGLREHLEGQLRSLDILCTISSRQIQDYAADGCLFFSFVQEKTAGYDIAEPRDQYNVKSFSRLLYTHSAGKSVSEDERRFFICVEQTVPSEFRFRYIVHPHQVFHFVHFKRKVSKFISDDWVNTDPFQMMLESGSKRPDGLSWMPQEINCGLTSNDFHAWLRQQYEQFTEDSVTDAHHRARFVPTRLLTFDPSVSEPRVRVVETRGVRQDDTKSQPNIAFAALSYCWGGDQKLKFSTTSRQILMAGIAFASLPRTFQDAVIVASKMGLSYLWADALCIMQDDSDDKERELAVMAKVYQNASLTIVASRAASVEDGFLSPRLPFEDHCGTPFRLRVRHTPDTAHSQSKVEEETEEAASYSSVICFPKMDMVTSGEDGVEPIDPVFTRAWCFQESALSPTVIEFGLLTTRIRHVSSMFGKPIVKYALDGWHNKPTSSVIVTHDILELSKTTDNALVNFWGRVIQYYSSRALSLPEDRLPALSALAETFGPYFDRGDNSYLAGLWRDSLPQALLWVVGVPETERDSRLPLSAEAYAPTWSWASVTSRVNGLVPLVMSPEDPFKADLGVEILGYTPKFVLPKVVFGAVSRGELRVRGRLRPVTLVLSDPYYLQYDDELTVMSSLLQGVDYSDHRQQSVRTFTRDGNHSVTRGLHRAEYDHPEAAYRDQILCAQVHLDRREADVQAIIAESKGLYLLPLISGPSEERKPHIDELCWNFRMPELRSIFGLLLVKDTDGKYSRVGVFDFSNKQSGSILDAQLLELEDSGALYEDQHTWIQGVELKVITIV